MHPTIDIFSLTCHVLQSLHHAPVREKEPDNREGKIVRRYVLTEALKKTRMMLIKDAVSETIHELEHGEREPKE